VVRGVGGGSAGGREVVVANAVGPTVGGGTTPVGETDVDTITDTDTDTDTDTGGPSSRIGLTGCWRGRSNATAAPTPIAPTTASAAAAIVAPDRFTPISVAPAPCCDTSWHRH
jgi:hypothetical protein